MSEWARRRSKEAAVPLPCDVAKDQVHQHQPSSTTTTHTGLFVPLLLWWQPPLASAWMIIIIDACPQPASFNTHAIRTPPYHTPTNNTERRQGLSTPRQADEALTRGRHHHSKCFLPPPPPYRPPLPALSLGQHTHGRRRPGIDPHSHRGRSRGLGRQESSSTGCRCHQGQGHEPHSP